MNPNSPLDSIVFITIPEDFKLSDKALPIDITIPLPVQKKTISEESFDPTSLTQEMILAGILTILAYDKENLHIGYYRSILQKVKPNIKQELTEAAILKIRNEDYEIAEEIFSALRGLDPEDMAIILNTALFFDQRADSYRNSGLLEDADAYDESAFTYYKIAMDADPAVPDAHFNAGFFFLKQKNFSKARSCFETFLHLIENFDEEEMGENGKYKKHRAEEIVREIESRNLDDELFKSAFDFISMGEEEKGLDLIKQFIEKNPRIWNAWFMLGWALRRLERWEDAKDAFLQTLELGGLNADTYNELSICLMELDDFKGAKVQLEKALHSEPENTKIISNLGFLALREGNPEEARNYFMAVLEFDPDDKLVLQALKDLEV